MTINELIEKDRTFTQSSFIAKVDNTFIMLLSSIMMKDIDRVKHKINDNIYNLYKIHIDELIKNNEIQMYDELNVKSTEILNITETDTKYVIEVLLVSRYMDYVIDGTTRQYKRGINTQRIEKNNYLTFEKIKDAKQQGVIKKCPGCGASIDFNNTGVCEYCHTSYNTQDYDWILTNIK